MCVYERGKPGIYFALSSPLCYGIGIGRAEKEVMKRVQVLNNCSHVITITVWRCICRDLAGVSMNDLG